MGTGVVGLEVTEEGPRGRGYIFCSARRETTSRPLCPTHSCLGLCPAGSSACSALLQPLHRLGHAGTSGPGANRAITPCFLQTATVPSSQCLRKYRWARGFTVLTVQVPIVCSSALAPCQAPCWWRLRGTRPALTNQLPVRSLLRPVFTERQTEPLRAQQPLRVSYWGWGLHGCVWRQRPAPLLPAHSRFSWQGHRGLRACLWSPPRLLFHSHPLLPETTRTGTRCLFPVRCATHRGTRPRGDSLGQERVHKGVPRPLLPAYGRFLPGKSGKTWLQPTPPPRPLGHAAEPGPDALDTSPWARLVGLKCSSFSQARGLMV